LVKNEIRTIGQCLDCIFDQIIDSEIEVIAIDSGSTDGTLNVLKKYDIKLIEIAPKDFQHGRTRNLGASAASGNIISFITADAVPASRSWLRSLSAPLLENDTIAAAYGRQLPRKDASYNTIKALEKIYPATPLVKQKADLSILGLRTYHMTNVNSAYIKSVWESTRFPEDLIACEDVGIAKRILEKGYRIAYVPEAAVLHSHNYSVGNILKRYFDIGVAYKRMGLLGAGSENLKITKRGKEHAFSEMRYALHDQGFLECANSFLLNLTKFIGLILGQHEQFIPKALKKTFSLYSNFWDLSKSKT
jgi:rhamnosyltransferase